MLLRVMSKWRVSLLHNPGTVLQDVLRGIALTENRKSNLAQKQGSLEKLVRTEYVTQAVVEVRYTEFACAESSSVPKTGSGSTVLQFFPCCTCATEIEGALNQPRRLGQAIA
jgi:hypothetical protein